VKTFQKDNLIVSRPYIYLSS